MDSGNTLGEKLEQVFGRLWQKVRARMPITRGRYEREINLLKLNFTRSLSDEKAALRDMTQKLYWVSVSPSMGLDGNREIRVSMRVNEDLRYFVKNPHFSNRYFYDIAENIAEKLKREIVSIP